MSRKRKAPKRKNYSDPKYRSQTVSKFINSIMYDGERSTAEKILYTALEKVKSKNADPLKVFNSAVNNVRPNLEVRSRRVGGATYQVPVEVKSNRSSSLALRWLLDASRKRKINLWQKNYFMKLWMLHKTKALLLKKGRYT